MNESNANGLLKVFGIIIGAILVIGLIFPMIGGIMGIGGGYHMQGGNGGMMNGGHNAMGGYVPGIGFGFGLADILGMLVKLLLTISIIGGVIGLVMYFVKNYANFFKEGISTLSTKQDSNTQCNNCQKTFDTNFKFCPNCGSPKDSQNISTI